MLVKRVFFYCSGVTLAGAEEIPGKVIGSISEMPAVLRFGFEVKIKFYQ